MTAVTARSAKAVTRQFSPPIKTSIKSCSLQKSSLLKPLPSHFKKALKITGNVTNLLLCNLCPKVTSQAFSKLNLFAVCCCFWQACCCWNVSVSSHSCEFVTVVIRTQRKSIQMDYCSTFQFYYLFD